MQTRRNSSTFGPAWAAAIALLTISGCLSSEPELSYSALLTEIEDGNVARLTLAEDHALVDFIAPPAGASSGELTYRVPLPRGESARHELAERLHEQGVDYVFAEPSPWCSPW